MRKGGKAHLELEKRGPMSALGARTGFSAFNTISDFRAILCVLSAFTAISAPGVMDACTAINAPGVLGALTGVSALTAICYVWSAFTALSALGVIGAFTVFSNPGVM